MFLAVNHVMGEEQFLATGDTPEEAYNSLQDTTECNPEHVTFFKLTSYPVRTVIRFEPVK